MKNNENVARTMRQLVLNAPRDLTLRETPIPECGSNEVLLKMVRTGVCGTDMHVYTGENKYCHYPIVPFHEGIGRVVETGEGVSHVKPGDLAVVRPIISCGKCYTCLRGRENACMNFNSLGVQSDGIGQDYFAIDKKYIYPIPDDMDLDMLILIEPFANAVHAAKRMDLTGKKVMVVGCGTIGNLTAQACKLYGAGTVCACDISDIKIRMAEESGIDISINNRSKTLSEAAEEAFGTYPDVVIDCVGSIHVFPQILDMVAKTTSILILGNYTDKLPIDLSRIQRNELNVLGCITYTAQDFQEAVDLVVAGKVYTKGFVGARYNIENAAEMMEYAVTHTDVTMKTVMDYE